MSVVDLLERAIKTNDWGCVREAFAMLGGKIDAAPAVEKPAPKKRTRTKKASVKEVKETKEFTEIPILEAPATPTQKDGEYTIARKRQTKDGHSLARYEDFQAPEIKFQSNYEVNEQKEIYDKINDRGPRTPRTREPTPYKTEVFCQDCKKHIFVHPQMARTPYYCEFPKLKKACPYAK